MSSHSEASDSSASSGPSHAVILAAGYGSRLDPDVGHKVLVEIDGTKLIDRHLENFAKVGVTDVTVVTGYEAEALTRELDDWETPGEVQLHTAHNPAFDLGNGISVLAGMRGESEPDVPKTPCWMTMSDHLFEPYLFDRLAEQQPWEQWAADGLGGVLAIDRKLDAVFDMPDANKVQFRDASDSELASDALGVAGARLSDIGKGLDDFQAVDVGLFWCAEGFAEALEAERADSGDCWTNDAVERLCDTNRFRFWDIDDARWCDVDTPDDRTHAEELVESFRD